MTAQLDIISYVRFPKLGVGGTLSLAKILLARVPKSSSAMVRKAAAIVEASVADLETKWMQQVVPLSRNLRPLAIQLGTGWAAIRDRLASYEAYPEGNPDRKRALEIHGMLFAEGLAFCLLSFPNMHAESARRILLIDERGLAKHIARLVGEGFLATLRAAHDACGNALGVNEDLPLPATPVVVVEPLRVLADAIVGYALQLLALARHDPEKHDAIAIALAPIDEFRTAAGRRVGGDDDDESESEEPETEAPTPAVRPTPAPVTPILSAVED